MLGDFMKIEIHDELHFVIYLNQYHMKEVNLHNKDTLEKYFKSLFAYAYCELTCVHICELEWGYPCSSKIG